MNLSKLVVTIIAGVFLTFISFSFDEKKYLLELLGIKLKKWLKPLSVKIYSVFQA
ncbi:MAG: hypothetical protein AAGJ08_15055 [Cyanobacteria bacterium P01_H01_bin.35]